MPPQTPAGARQAAHAILAEGRFHQPSVPRPFHGLIEAVGRALSDPLGEIDRLISSLGRWFPGGVAGVWAACAVLVVALTGALAARRARNRLASAGGAIAAAGPDAAALERDATQAERQARWAEAVRLRFRAGLLRLAERRDDLDPVNTPNRDLARRLGSAPLEHLSARFDEIVYGAADATAEDAEAQRREWPEILRAGGSGGGSG